MQIDRERAKSAFWAYVNGFDVQKDMIRLKVEHTFRVSQLCEEIADSLGLSKEDRDLAWLIGLLHDLEDLSSKGDMEPSMTPFPLIMPGTG